MQGDEKILHNFYDNFWGFKTASSLVPKLLKKILGIELLVLQSPNVSPIKYNT